MEYRYTLLPQIFIYVLSKVQSHATLVDVSKYIVLKTVSKLPQTSTMTCELAYIVDLISSGVQKCNLHKS